MGLGGNDNITGLAGDDKLLGGDANDTLDGGAGADTLDGGAGNDLFLISDAGDVVLELADGGADTVITAINFTLPNHVEAMLIAEGASGITITGGAGNDVLIGNGLANTFDGGAGDDVILAGNVTLADIYALFAM
jgi:Ca2+-binding RTX toxin-like protein